MSDECSAVGRIGIIGGAGRMGSWFAHQFEAASFPVLISDINAGVPVESLLESAHTVIVSVPMHATKALLESIVPRMRREQLLVDLTSLKVEPLSIMNRSAGEVLGLHPMFGPDATSFAGQLIVACAGRIGERASALLAFLAGQGARIARTDAVEHDRIMAIVQGLNHFHAIVFGAALKRLGVDFSRTMELASPNYGIRAEMMGRVLAQDPELYADIELLNPEVGRAVDSLLQESAALRDLIARSDRSGFLEYLRSVSDYCGDFPKKALAASSELIQYRAMRRGKSET